MMDDVVAGLLAGGWLWWFSRGGEWVWGLDPVETLVAYIALVHSVRLLLRWNRTMLVHKYHHEGKVPSLWEALSAPRTAWEPWPEGMV